MNLPRAQDPAPSAQLRAVAVVPARLESTRLARKMLLRESGQYLFEHTVRSVRAARLVERVVLATDSSEILAAAKEVGVECVLTSDRHKSGTDRVHEAVQCIAQASDRALDVILNVQGDEPEIDGGDLDRLIAVFAEPEVETATLWGTIESEVEANAPSVVKVVADARGDALYFSRAPIPTDRHSRSGAAPDTARRRHIGVYAFRPAALTAFCSLPEGALERIENLEQLRWLEAGRKMRTVQANCVPRGIDTREDYEAFLARIATGEDLQKTNP